MPPETRTLSSKAARMQNECKISIKDVVDRRLESGDISSYNSSVKINPQSWGRKSNLGKAQLQMEGHDKVFEVSRHRVKRCAMIDIGIQSRKPGRNMHLHITAEAKEAPSFQLTITTGLKRWRRWEMDGRRARAVMGVVGAKRSASPCTDHFAASEVSWKRHLSRLGALRGTSNFICQEHIPFTCLCPVD
ncbi:predicted protein [Uncinocarpus reesii 1704]|uniref:Uncharacterized protein n=1 Tax=Uncinocarpus reesii (strain UAMH 1704) TaxID=336963 RepID=C4JKJ6_UNCRE|nr:uncharacterized protein UREG_02153 [Uncinocarpus reesii 1704]EEP77304.1 predicted protein [Uncinocarpus reesii 1704]